MEKEIFLTKIDATIFLEIILHLNKEFGLKYWIKYEHSCIRWIYIKSR